MTWITIGIVVVLTGVLALVPDLSRDTVPLGVSVPSDRTADPVVRRAIGAFRLEVLAAAAVLVAGSLVLAGSHTGTTLAALLAPGLLIALGFAALVVARRPIVTAKREQDWYAGHEVRLVAQVTQESSSQARAAMPWYAVSAVLVALTAVVGAVRYDDQPDPYPTHWTMGGHADSFAAKSPWIVFGVVFVMAGLVIGMTLIALLVQAGGTRKYPDGDLVRADVLATAKARATQSALGVLTSLLVLGLAVVQIGIWSGSGESASPILMVVFLLLALAGVVATVGLTMRAARSAPRVATTTDGPETPDDDRHWRGGILYVNRDDPSLLVPKRVGVGWTLNFARPAALLLCLALLVVVVALAVLGATH